MLKVGLTGGIGSGKTTVSKVFNILGIPVYNSDNVAKYLMNTSPIIKSKLIDVFGTEIYDENNKLNKALLADKIFNNSQYLKIVNSIVHPEVKNNFNIWLKQHSTKKYVIKEAAILIESGIYKELDKIILVTASEKTRIKRLSERENWKNKQIIERMKNQWTDSKKTKYADFIIENDKHMILEQILTIHNKLIK